MNIRRMLKKAHKGFSLVELLVTLAIIITLAVMLTSRGSRSFQQKQLATCEKNLQSMFTALSLYNAEANGRYPFDLSAGSSEKPLSLLIPRSTTVTEIFICPGTKAHALPPGESFTNSKISYAYYMGWDKNAGAAEPLVSDQQINTARKKQGQQLFSPDGKGAGANHNKFGGNLLFGDGSVRKSKSKTEFDLFFPTNVTLLNPRS